MRSCVIVAVVVLAVAISAESDQTRREVCYDKYGCFNTNSPWTSLLRPLRALPNPPHEVQTRFVLFTRDSEEYINIGYDMMLDKDAILKLSPFKASRRTVLIIHGFTDSHKAAYVWKTKDNLLQQEDINVIAVDWKAGAKSPYLQATANARLVGAHTALFLNYLQQKADLQLEDVHIIGHNLGAHVAGYVGQHTNGQLPRITAVDPSDPYFADTDPQVRLDTGDAQFVEVIHTNGNGALNFGMGIAAPIGHVDIYPNGGKLQPGCKDTLGSIVGSIIELITLNFEGAISIWACSHLRGADLYAESIAKATTCPFIAYQCSDYSQFEKGNCYSACSDPGRCLPLGYNSRNFTGSGNYYLHTGDGNNATPYCKQSVQVQILISPSQAQATGSLTIQFRGSDGTRSEKFSLVSGSTMNGGQMVSKWVEVPSHILLNPTDRNSLILNYQRGGLLPINQPRTLNIASVNLLTVDTALKTNTISYGSVTLDYGTDTQISETSAE